MTEDSENQRAGRAGRLGPGVALRLWDRRDRLRPHREAEISRIDLAAPVLDVIAWGGDPVTFEWFEAPSRDSLDAAVTLLARLGAVADGRLTPLGRRLRELPLHPRLGAVLAAGRGSHEASAACALLSDGVRGRGLAVATTCDLWPLIDQWHSQPPPIRQAAEQLGRLAADWPDAEHAPHVDDEDLCRALLAGFPDRVARRRDGGSRRLLLASGTGRLCGG